MGLSIEDKIAKMKKKGWEFNEYKNSQGSQVIGATFYEPIGRNGKKRDIPLYKFSFPSWERLVFVLYYGSVGTQKDLAQEFGVTEQEISYIKSKRMTGEARKRKKIDDFGFFYTEVRWESV